MGSPLPRPVAQRAVVAGLTAALAFGSIAAPLLSAPTAAYAASGLSAVSLSDEMKYFTKYESGKNYRQGFSSGDGYNALGYYQFDRRFSLGSFIEQAYAYNPTKYAALKEIAQNSGKLKTEQIASSGKLTDYGQRVQDAWYAAYDADPAEFSALQDSYAYNTYYLPVQRVLLNGYGVDISDRADCVKGLAWSLCNWLGQGGVRAFFDWAKADSGLSDNMTDRELVNALCDAVVNHIKDYSSQSQYYAGWITRYGTNERNVCLAYIAEDEQLAAGSGSATTTPPEAGGSDAAGDSTVDSGVGDGSAGSGDAADNNAGATTAPDTGATTAPDVDAGADAGDGSLTGGAAKPETSDDAATDDAGSAGDTGADGTTSDSAGNQGGSTDGSTSSDGADNAAGDQITDTGTTDNAGAQDGSSTVNDATGDTQAGASADGGASTAPAEEPTVTFTVKGKAYKAIQAKDGKVTSIVAPQYQGYSFAGWYLNGERYCGENEEISVSSDTELIAFYRKDDAAPTSQPDGLPQTGDNSAIISMGAIGLTVAGMSVAMLGVQRRREAQI